MKRRLKKDFVPVAIMLCLLIFGFYAQAHATIVTYSDESTFLSAAPIASTEDFEGFSSGFIYSSTVVFDEVVYIFTPKITPVQLKKRLLQRLMLLRHQSILLLLSLILLP